MSADPRICACCAAPLKVTERVTVATEWEHRLDGYCYHCASMRCDAYPGSHSAGTQTKTAWLARTEGSEHSPNGSRSIRSGR